MKLSSIVSFLDNLFDLKSLEDGRLKDNSMLSRMKLIPESKNNEFLSSFFKIMNGLLFQSTDEIDSIVFSAFLSDNVVLNLKRKGHINSLLIVHHLFDMNCGTPKEMNGVPFHFLSMESLEILKRNHISVYAAHLPLDLQDCRFNTSLAFTENLTLSDEFEPLHIEVLDRVGYQLTTNLEIGEYLKKRFHTIYRYGKGSDYPCVMKKVAIIAGVVSNIDILKDLERQSFTHLICGDIFLCVDSHRFRAIYDYAQKTSLCIFCLSHHLTESYSLVRLSEFVAEHYESIVCECIFEDTDWK